MRKSLAIASGLAALVATDVQAQTIVTAPPVEAGLARTRALDLRITRDPALTMTQPLVRGMIASKQLSPNATIGIGLANLYGRKKGDFRVNGGPGRGRKPAVTFQLRF